MSMFPHASLVTNCIGRSMLPPTHSSAMASIVMPSDRWARRCTVRLMELKPRADRLSLEAVAAELSEVLGSFDPEIAAEMEFESGVLDD